MTFLPNLSNLNIGIPGNDQVPKFQVEVRQVDGSSSSTSPSTPIPTMQTRTIGILDMYELFARGAVFSCINKQIIITANSAMEDLDRVLFQGLGALSQEDGGELDEDGDGISSGSWNLGLTISTADEAAGKRDVLGQRASILWSVNMQAAQAGVVEPVNKVFVRMSKDEEIYQRLYKEVGEDSTKVNQLLFQEMYLTLYAAQRGVGVDVYAAKGIQKSYRDADSLPSVVYFLEAADGDLDGFCDNRPTPSSIPSSTQACKDLYSLIQKASASRMLLVDHKPGNTVFIKRPGGGVDFRLIDFGADYAAILPKDLFSIRCIHFANCSMFASFVASHINSGAGRLGPGSVCLTRLAYLPYKFVKSYLTSMEATSFPQSQRDDETLCTALLMARASAKDDSFPFEDSMLDMVHQYIKEDTIRALISQYLFVYDTYTSTQRFNNRPGGRIIRTIFRSGEGIDLAQPFLKQMLAIVMRRFAETEATGAFDDLKSDAVESESPESSEPPRTPQRSASRSEEEEDEDKLTPLDSWIKNRDGDLDSDYELTPKDKQIVDEEGKQKLEEARQVREQIRKREGKRGAEERERKQQDLKRTPIRRFEVPDDEELDVLVRG
jgi:hypothetical protein